MRDSWKQLNSDNTPWQNILTNSHNLQSQWHVVSFRYHETTFSLTRKVGFKGTPTLDPYWKSQPSHLQSKRGVEIRIEPVNKDNSHSWVRISHGVNELVTDLIDKNTTTTSRRHLQRSICVCKTIQGYSKTDQTLNYLLMFKEKSYSWKDMGWYWTRSSIRSSLLSGKKNKHSSSTRRTTSRRRWGDRILETERWSSEQIWVLPILVWWCMEEQDGRKRRQQQKISTVLTRQDKKFFTFDLFKGHSGRNPIDPSLQDNVLIPNNFFEYIYYIGCAVNLHSITNSGLTPGGQNSSRDRQTEFFTAVNPNKNHQDPIELDLTKRRLASYKQKWKVHQDTVYWVDIQLAQRNGMKFHQTRSNAVILNDTLPAYCLSKAIVMKSEEIKNQKVYVSPRPPPTISNKINWTCDLDSDVARSSKDIQRIELKPNTQLSSARRLVTGWREETLERTKFDRDTLHQEKHDNVTDPTSTEKPVCGHESTKRCVLTPKHCWKWSKQVRGDQSRWIKKE